MPPTCTSPARCRRSCWARSTATAPTRSSRRAGRYHWFGGDGMIHAFHIENGNVSYKNRWVRTPKWEIENKEGEGLSGTFGNPMLHRPARHGAELDHRQHQHRLARRQAAGARGGARALRARSRDLDAVGPTAATRPTATSSSARSPRIPSSIPRPARWCSSAIRPRAASPRKSASRPSTQTGKITRAEILEGPFPSMVHDFAVTKNWIVLPIFPLTCVDGARDGRQAAVRLGARQGHAHRLHPAQRHGRRREVGDARPPPTSSIR